MGAEAMTAAEADMWAAQQCLHLLATRPLICWQVDADSEPKILALQRIEQWLRLRACGGDKTLARQLERELGHQVKPMGKKARAIERLARKTEKS